MSVFYLPFLFPQFHPPLPPLPPPPTATPSDTCLSTTDLSDERVAALNTPLARSRLPDEDQAEDDDAELALMAAAAGEELEEVRRRRNRTRRLQKLFAGCRVFIGREVGRAGDRGRCKDGESR